MANTWFRNYHKANDYHLGPDPFAIVCTTESGHQQFITVGNVPLESAVLTMRYLRECNPTKRFRLVGKADKFQDYVNELCPE